MSTQRKVFLLACALGVPVLANAAPVNWPGGSAPCNGTLQACIDGVGSGVTIQITTATPINESLILNKSVGLAAAPFVRASLASGRGISGSVSGANPWNLSLRGLGLRDAAVQFFYQGTLTAEITIENLRIESSAASNPAGIRVETGASAAPSTVRVLNNRLKVAAPGLFDAAIEVEFAGGAGHLADIRWNQVESVGESTGWGVVASARGGATCTFELLGNEVRGHFGRAGIGISEGLFSDTASSVTARVFSNVVIGAGGFSNGIRSVVNQGNISADITNNTVVRATGIVLTRWSGGGGGPPAIGTTSGRIFNNLIVANRFGLQNSASGGGTATNNYNLLRNNASPGLHTAGPNDVSADPLLRSLDAPRLGAGSPAIDAGNSTVLIGILPLPLLDADGLRRIVNGDAPGNQVDIGAYESGHRVLRADSTAAVLNHFPISDPRADTSDGSLLFTTLNVVIPLSFNPRPVGVYFASGWRIFNQDFAPMPNALSFNVFHPLPSSTLTMQTVAATLPSFPNAIAMPTPGIEDLVFAEQNWNGFGALGVYNDNPIAVGRSGGNWFLHNANGVALPTGAKFNVYWQPTSPNVFSVFKTAGDGLSNSVILIDHPLLNNNPCARFVVTPRSSGPAAEINGSIFDVFYLLGGAPQAINKWTIFSSNGSIASREYHVLVVPEQVSDCTLGPLFRDQFEQ